MGNLATDQGSYPDDRVYSAGLTSARSDLFKDRKVRIIFNFQILISLSVGGMRNFRMNGHDSSIS